MQALPLKLMKKDNVHKADIKRLSNVKSYVLYNPNNIELVQKVFKFWNKNE